MNRKLAGCTLRTEIVALCYKRLDQAGLSPSELSTEGLRLLVWCAVRDRLAATRQGI